MKKNFILFSFIFMFVSLSGCSSSKTSDYDANINKLEFEANSIMIVEEGIDAELDSLEMEDFSSTDELDDEFDNALKDELQINEELDELESEKYQI